MRAWVLAGVLLIAAGGLFLLLSDRESTREGVEGGAPDVLDDGLEEPAPELLGAGDGRPHVPVEIRGRGSIQGTVTRRDEPVEARVELRHVAAIDPSNPFGGGLFQMMIERMLDAGVSTKEVIARTQSGVDGTYHFGGLAPGMYEVRAVAPSGAVGFASATLPAHGARVEASIQMPAGGERLEGRVVYADGKPYQGLVLALGGEGFALLLGGAGDLQPTWSDADGRFVLEGLAPGSVRISAVIPGVMRVLDAPITLPYGGDYVLTIDVAGVEANGRVISAATEAPIAGASVFAGGGDMESSFSIRTTTTDADGRFELTVPAGRGGMFVKAEGYAPENVEFRAGSRTGLVVPLRRLARISGRVLAQGDRTPLAGVNVVALPEDSRGGPPSLSGTRTDAQGRYVLSDVLPGSVRLVALGAGWFSAGAGVLAGLGNDDFNPNVVQVEPGGEAEMDVEVMPAAAVAGRVTTAAGDPIAGCVVQPGQGEGLPGPAAALMGLGIPVSIAVTDADGRYLLDTLVPDQEYALSARAPGQPDARSDRFKAVGGKTHEIDLRFASARWLDVRVVDAIDGTPVVGARVRVVPASGGGNVVRLDDFFGGGTRTDRAGRARVGPLPTGTLVAYVTAAGYVKKDDFEVGEVAPGDLALTIELTRGLVIAGRVESPAGMPVQGVRVTVRTEWSRRSNRAWVRLRPTVAADGSFRVDTLPDAGDYRVEAQAYWEDATYEAQAVVQAGDEEVLLELIRGVSGEEGPSLTVRVVDHEGAPVPSGRIQLYTYEGGRSSSSSEQRLSNGEATFASVEEDRELWIEVWQVTGGERGATIHGPLDGSATEVDVRLPAALSVAGSVIGPDGKGVRSVRVVAKAMHPSEHEQFAEEHGVAFSDADGRFRIQGLGDLDYRLGMQVPTDYAPVPAQVVRAGANDVRVTLRAGVAAVLTVLDYQGKPVAGAQPGIGGKQGRTDAQGVFTMRGLPPDGVFELKVSPPEGRPDLRPFEREGWTPQDETITLERAFSISGVVKDQHGQPVPHCFVGYRPVGGDAGPMHQTDHQGRFTIPALAAGRYELSTFVPGDMGRGSEPTVTVAAGATGVVLTVDLGASLKIRVRNLEGEPDPLGSLRMVGPGRQALLRSQKDESQVGAHLYEDGRATFQGLDANTSYTLSILALPGGHYVLVGDLRPGPDEILVEAQEGGAVRGRVVVPEGVAVGTTLVQLVDAEGMRAFGRTDPSTGAFAIEGLPEGSWTASASTRAGTKQYRGEASVSTGGEVEIRLVER